MPVRSRRPDAGERGGQPSTTCRRLTCGLLVWLPATVVAGQTIRVPADAPTLEAAIAAVADGGVIEVADGTYRPQSPDGLQLDNLEKGFTIRATGTAAVIDGGGQGALLDLRHTSPERGGRMVFDGLTFANGAPSATGSVRAITLRNGEAVFRDCSIRDNRGETIGGAMLVDVGGRLVMVGGEVIRNTTTRFGGGIAIQGGEVYVRRTRFVGNRANPAGHRPDASGGAIGMIDGRLRVYDAVFEGNQSGWTAGAIYARGEFREPLQVPSAEVLIAGTSFDANGLAPLGQLPGPTFGGAIHVEDQVTLRVSSSVFRGNVAERGGGISAYRAIVEIRGTWFVANGAATVGTVSISGSDVFIDSTEGSLYNPDRRVASGILEDVTFLATDRPAATRANNGDCLRVGGDVGHQFNLGTGSPATLAANRSRVEVRRTVFVDCATRADAVGQGAAMLVLLGDVLVEDSLFLRSRVLGDGEGGAIRAVSQSRLVVRDSSFAGNEALRGAALAVIGSELELEGSTFVANEVSPGEDETVSRSLGSALFSRPTDDPDPVVRADVTGSVVGNTFVDEGGVAIFENDLTAGPINDLGYADNEFFGGRFGATVFINSLASPGGTLAGAIDGLVVARGNGTSTLKGLGGNRQLGSRPRQARLLAGPSRLLTGGQGPLGGVGWVHTGAAATLAGTSVPAFDFATRSVPGAVTLTVDNQLSTTATLADVSCTDAHRLCLGDDRFVLDLDWQAPRTGAPVSDGHCPSPTTPGCSGSSATATSSC